MIIRSLVAVTLLSFSTYANADPQFKAADVEKHYTKNAECKAEDGCLQKLGKARKVCFGTESECAAEDATEVVDADPGAFDMLITFELGSDRLSQQARENLAEFARALKGDVLGKATFSIDGHTDARGTDSFNQVLSERRAAAVVSFLQELGIERSRLAVTGHGENKPRDEDPFAAINRRVEATLKIQ